MSNAQPDCLFCKILAREIPATIVYEDELTVAFMDISPANPGHLLVIPRSHSRDLLEIEADDLSAVALTAQKMAARVKTVLGADGVNLLNCCGTDAWQTVFHFHMHVIPRMASDPLRLPWIPASGDPDEIRQVGERLAAA